MSMPPTIRTLPSGDVVLKATPEALRISKAIDHAPKVRSKSKTHVQVHTAALNSLKADKIKKPDELLIRSRYELQFGKYRGQTFKWLLENDMGYAAYVVNDMQQEGGHTPDTPLGLNKFHLKVRLPFFCLLLNLISTNSVKCCCRIPFFYHV